MQDDREGNAPETGEQGWKPAPNMPSIAPSHLGNMAKKGEMEAWTGFEPVNNGFADHSLRPLGHHAL